MEKNKADMVCVQCGHVGVPVMYTKGSFAIELVLWLCFLVPGVIYSFWRLSNRGKMCSVCKGTQLIPVNSPMGQKLIAKQ